MTNIRKWTIVKAFCGENVEGSEGAREGLGQ